MPNAPTQSESRFEAYVVTHGYVGERAVDWRGRFSGETFRDPDFLVCRAREELAICEVEEWTSSPVDRGLAVQRIGSFGSEEIYGTAAMQSKRPRASSFGRSPMLGCPLWWYWQTRTTGLSHLGPTT